MIDRKAMARLLERYPPPKGLAKEGLDGSGSVRLSPQKLSIDRSIDLHGLTAREAYLHLDRFVRQAVKDRVRKVLIVHGKGNRLGSESVLKKVVREYVEQNPHIGATGTPGAEHGGTGATWAVIRQRSR